MAPTPATASPICGVRWTPSESRDRTRRAELRPWQSANKGYALLVLMIIVTVMLISMTSALPSIYQTAQRKREAEAIFRGEQYARAIYLYYRTEGHYPTSVKDLLDTNGTRFLRQPYPDPLNPNGRWHFLHAAANGIILDSASDTSPAVAQPGAAAQPQPAGGLASSPASGSQTTGQPPAFGQAPSPGVASGGQSGPFGQAPSPGAQQGSQSSTFGQTTAANGKKKPVYPPPDCVANTNSFSGPTAQTGQLLGAFIVGVAPCSNHASIREFNHQKRYNDWEFLGLKYTPYSLPKVQTVQPSSSFPNTTPGQPQPGMLRSPPTNPPGSQNPLAQPAQGQDSGSSF